LELIRQALATTDRNPKPLVLYVVVLAAASALAKGGLYLLGKGGVENIFLDPTALAYTIVSAVLVAVLVSATQSVVFGMLGREIDRPLWKLSGSVEALRRFFPLWLVMNLVVVGLELSLQWVLVQIENTSLGALLLALWMMALVLYLPVGAGIMFWGKLEWDKLGEIFAPLLRQIGRTLQIILLSLGVSMLSLYLLSVTAGLPWLTPAVVVIGGYFDCVIFSGIWLVYLFDRQNPEEVDIEF